MNCEYYNKEIDIIGNNENEDDDLISLISDVQRDSGNSSDCSSILSSSNYCSSNSTNLIASKIFHQDAKFNYAQLDSIEFNDEDDNDVQPKSNNNMQQDDANEDGDDEDESEDEQEQESNNLKSSLDISLLNDERTITNLLQLEDYYRINSNYFLYVQNEIKPWMRKMLSKWMLEVCKNQSRENDIFVLAMNILDRFLSVQLIGKRHLQLLGTVCMFIAGKLRSAIQFNAETLAIYTANSITVEELLNWEQFVLQKLRWDICSIIPNDFLPILLKNLNLFDLKNTQTLIEYSNTFISLCSTDFKFSMMSSSMIASSCLYASMHYLNINKTDVLNKINLLTNIDLECLKECIQQVIDLIETSLNIKFQTIELDDEENIKIQLNNTQNNDSMLYETAAIVC